MDENEEIKKDREAFKKYLEKGNNSDFIKFVEEFSKNAKYISKLIDDGKFKIDYYDTIKNPLDIKSTPARIKGSGIIEVDKKHFLKKSIEYHKFNYGMRTTVIHTISNMDGEMRKNTDVTNEKIREWFDYADISLRRLKESEDALIKAGIIKKRDYTSLDLIKFFISNLTKKYGKLN